MPLPRLDNEYVTAYFDEEVGISYITYRGTLNSDLTKAVFDWVRELIPHLSAGATHGVVYDFREVKTFAPGYVSSTQRESRQINQERDNTDHPVALIVANMMQEQMVRVTMHLAPHESRKRLVYSVEEAHQFIEEWHADNQ